MSEKLRDQFVKGLMTAREYHEASDGLQMTYAGSLRWIVNQTHMITENYKGADACVATVQFEKYLVWFVGMQELDQHGLTCEPHPFMGAHTCVVCGFNDGGQVWHVG